MKIPNGSQAIIHSAKLQSYLLNDEHERGKTKASLLLAFGYEPEKWHILEQDLRQYHAIAETTAVRETPYGTRYEVRAPLQTPSGRSLIVRSIWQIDKGTEYPRFITLFPD